MEAKNLQRESRDANVRKIEYMIRHEKQIAEAVEEAKLSPSSNLSGEHTGHSYIPDPTASQAIRHAAEVPKVFVDGRTVEWPERWLKVIRAVRAWCVEDSIRGEIFRRRYGGHRKESRFLTMDSLHIAERTYYSVLDDIRAYAIQCAAQAQVVRVF